METKNDRMGVESLIPIPNGNQDFNKPLGTNLTFNSHNVADWSNNPEVTRAPGNPMDVLETGVTGVDVNQNPGLTGQPEVGAGLESLAWDVRPV